MRYCFKTDEDGHNFLIPHGLSEKFEQMLENGEDDYWTEFSNEFGKYNIDAMTNWTFENPQEDA